METEPDHPTTLGRYRILGRSASRGRGRVLLGEDASGRRVAITVPDPADPAFRERFRHEVRAAAGAPPWFVALVLDADVDAPRPWVATAHLEGPSLQAYVTEHGPLGEPGVLALAARTADGLVALHGVGLAHRGLSPSTVLLADDGPRLVDLALARTGPPLGPPSFLAPEQAYGAVDVGPPSDVFSFGTLLVFAATGRSPFAMPAAPAEAVLQRVVSGEPHLGTLGGPLRTIVLACLAKDPAARPSAEQLREMLRVVAGSDVTVVAAPLPAPGMSPTVALPTVALPPSRPPFSEYDPVPTARRGRRTGLVVGIAAAAVVVLLGLAVGTVLVLAGRARETPVASTAPQPPANAGSPSASVAPSSTPSAGEVIDADTDPRFGAGSATFATPSGNITCAMTADGTRCDVLERTWQIPPKPADCLLDYGSGTILQPGQPGQLLCAGNTVADPSLPVLAYGETVRFAGVECASRQTGVRCTDTASGHGFEVARAAYQVF